MDKEDVLPEPDVEAMVKMIVNPELYAIWKRKESQERKSKEDKTELLHTNQQIQSLEISDYLRLFASQKKGLNPLRLAKLKRINNSLLLEQEDFKYFFSVASQANFRRLEHPGYYAQILTQQSKYPPHFFSSIDKDIPRTLLNEHPFQTALRNVLVAYAIRNPSLLYCQGMNYLVAYLLINELSEESTFWFMVCLIENILPCDFFKDLTTISITSSIFTDLLDQIFPELKKQMDDVGMDASIFLVSWYVCLFSKGFINSVSAYMINTILIDSFKYRIGFILLRVSLGIIAAILTREQPFTYRKDFKSFKETLQTKVFEISLAEIKEGLEMIELNYQNYVLLEDHYRRKKEEKKSVRDLRDSNKKMPLPLCSKEYPVCLHRVQIQKRIGSVEQALILRNNYSIKEQYIENYLENQESPPPHTFFYNSIDECQITRHSHICHLADSYQHERWAVKKGFKRQTCTRIQLLEDQEDCEQRETHLSKIQDKFAELSEYFEIDQDFNFEKEQEEEYIQIQPVNRQKSQIIVEKDLGPKSLRHVTFANSNELPKQNQSKFTTFVQNALRKVSSGMSFFKRVKSESKI